MPSEPSPRAAFLSGARDTFPLVLGAVPFGVIFGVLAINAGLTPLAALGMSLFVFAGSAQFIATGLVGQGVGLGFIVLTTLVVNLRHALYGASLSAYLQHLPQKWLLPFGFWLTDETYAVTIARFQRDGDARFRHWYYLGSALPMYLNWQLCTLFGIFAGTRLQGAADWGLDVAMVVTFTGIVVPLLVSVPMLICALVAGTTAVLCHALPNKLGLLLAAVCAIAAGLLSELWLQRRRRV